MKCVTQSLVFIFLGVWKKVIIDAHSAIVANDG